MVLQRCVLFGSENWPELKQAPEGNQFQTVAKRIFQFATHPSARVGPDDRKGIRHEKAQEAQKC
jgi:hypothetical protein